MMRLAASVSQFVADVDVIDVAFWEQRLILCRALKELERYLFKHTP